MVIPRTMSKGPGPGGSAVAFSAPRPLLLWCCRHSPRNRSTTDVLDTKDGFPTIQMHLL